MALTFQLMKGGQDLAVQMMKALGPRVLVAVVAILTVTRVVRLL